MNTYELMSDTAYDKKVTAFIKSGEKRWGEYCALVYNALQRYQAHTNAVHLNNIVNMAVANRYAGLTSKLIKAVKLHTQDKATKQFKDGKVDPGALAKLRANWELIFELWLKDAIKFERASATFDENAAIKAIEAIFVKLARETGQEVSTVRNKIVHDHFVLGA